MKYDPFYYLQSLKWLGNRWVPATNVRSLWSFDILKFICTRQSMQMDFLKGDNKGFILYQCNIHFGIILAYTLPGYSVYLCLTLNMLLCES